MDVDQRLDEVKRMCGGLRDLGIAPESHGNMIAALYFCEGVTALPVVIGNLQEGFVKELTDRQSRLEEILFRGREDLESLRKSVDGRFDAQFDALVYNNHVLAEQTKVLSQLLKERGCADETIQVEEQESEIDRRWKERNAFIEGTDVASHRDAMLDTHDAG